MSRNDALRFREVQRIRDPVLWFVVLTLALLVVLISIAEPMPLALRAGLVGVAVAAVTLLWAARLVVEVHPDAVSIDVGLPGSLGSRRVIPGDGIRSVGRHRHNPATTFGRWGIHLGLGDPATYNVAGDDGVVLGLREGTVIVGTARPADLAAAVRGLDAEGTGENRSLRGRTSLGSVTSEGVVLRSKE
jgi:hypothetical protein